MLGRKVIYVRCMNCSYSKLDKKAIKNFVQVRAFERYIPLNKFVTYFCIPLNAMYCVYHLLNTVNTKPPRRSPYI